MISTMPKTTQWGALRPKLIAVSVAACFALSSPQISANPTGASIGSGSATFATAGSSLTVTNSANAVINWQGFSIGINEITRFIQPSALSAVLNRVVGSGGAIPQSVIDGILSSNGRVFLLNPSGIIVGAGATIDTAGIVLSSLNLSDQDFLNGRLRFTEVPGAGAVVNNGVIQTASGGNVYLIAPTVENNGLIRSPQGEIVLAAGKSVELVADSSPYVTVRVTADTEQAVNVGSLVADSGRVGVYGALVRNSGVAEANGAVVGEGGQIRFVATRDLNIEAGSRISANGGAGGSVLLQAEGGTNLIAGTVEATGSSGKGGTVQALGVRVGVVGNGVIDASGETGGGTVLVGGDYQGKNPGIQNAQSTEIGADGVIRADARTTGDGGRVIVWADGDTGFHGSIAVRGGSESGNGGFVETSGKQTLTVAGGRVDSRAPHGSWGNWLLDPSDYTIDSAEAGSIETNFSTNGTTTVSAYGSIFFDSNLNLVYGSAGQTFYARATNNIDLAHVGGAHSITTNGQNVVLSANDSSPGTPSGTGSILGGGSISTGGGYVDLYGVAVNVGSIITRGANGASPGAYGLSGGSVYIYASGGAVSTGEINTSGGNGAAGANAIDGSGGWGGSGGYVQIYNASSITTGPLTTRGGDGGPGGSFSQTGNGGTYSVNVNGGGGSQGGGVYLDTSGALTVNGAINTGGGRGANGGTGSISITSSAGSENAYVYASGAEGGQGGYVNLYGSTITAQDITTRGGDGGHGGSATIVVDGAYSVYAYANARGADQNFVRGGQVYMSSSGHITAGTIDTRGGLGGNGGNASIVASNVVADGYVNAYAYASGGDGGEGASVQMYSDSASSITVGNIFTMGGNGGNGGAATVTVSGSPSYVNAYAQAQGGRGYYGGSVTLDASGPVLAGIIDTRGGNGGNGGSASVTVSGATGDVYASSYGYGGSGYYGGTVTISSNSSIATGAITTMGGSGVSGGNATVSVSGSPSYVSAYADATGGYGDHGGSVSLDSAGTIQAGNIDARGGSGGNGGSASVTVSGATGTVYASAYGYGGSGYYGGTVAITSSSSILTGAITTMGGSGGNGGNANVSVSGSPGYVNAYASAGGGQGYYGGSVVVLAGGSILTGNIDASGGKGGNGGAASAMVSGATESYVQADASGGSGGSNSSSNFGGSSYYGGGSGIPVSVVLSANGSVNTGTIFNSGGSGGNAGTAVVSTSGSADSLYTYNDGGWGGDGGLVYVYGSGVVNINVGGPPTGLIVDVSGGAGGAGGPAGMGGYGGHGGDVLIAGTPTIELWGSINASAGAGGGGTTQGAPGEGGNIFLDATLAGTIFVWPGIEAQLFNVSGDPLGLFTHIGQIVFRDPLSIPEVNDAYQRTINKEFKSCKA